MRYLVILALIAVQYFSSFSWAQEADPFGDPLPEAAIARLGTIRLRHQANSITGVVFSHDSKLLATATNNSPYVFVFDTTTGQRVAAFGPDDPNANLYWNGSSLTFAPDNQSLLIMNLFGGQVERLDMASGKRMPVAKPDFQAGIAQSSPDGRRVAIVDPDGQIRVLDYATLKSLATIGKFGDVEAMSFDAAGKLIAVGDRVNKKFEIWSIETGKLVWSAKGEGYDYSIALSPSGKQVAFTPGKSGFSVLTLGEEQAVIEQSSGSAKGFSFSPDESTLVVQGGSSFEFWDLAKKEVTREQRIGFTGGVQIAPDGKTVALVKSSNGVRLFDIATGEERPKFDSHYGEIKGIAISHDGSRVLTCGWGDATIVWDVATQKPIYRNDTGSRSPKALAITPDGKQVIYGWGTMTSIDLASGEQKFKARVSSNCETLRYSPDASLLLATDKVDTDHGVSILDAATGERTKLLKAETTSTLVSTATWLPDGKHVAAYDSPTKISIWNIDSGERTVSFEREKSGVSSLAVHPAGKVLASFEGGFNSKLRFYKIDSGEVLDLNLEGYDPERRSQGQQVAFTGDGRFLVARIDFRLHIWDLRTRKLLTKLGSQADWLGPFAISDDGRRLVACTAMNHLLVWDLAQLTAK